jgi:hypothetical protein
MFDIGRFVDDVGAISIGDHIPDRDEPQHDVPVVGSRLGGDERSRHCEYRHSEGEQGPNESPKRSRAAKSREVTFVASACRSYSEKNSGIHSLAPAKYR